MIPDTPPSSGRRKPHCRKCGEAMAGHPRGSCTTKGSDPGRATSLPANFNAIVYPSFASNTTPSTETRAMSVISESREDDDKLEVKELKYPTTPIRGSNKSLPKPAAVVYDDSVNPLRLQSQSKAPHFGVLLTEHSDGGYRQWWVLGEKNIVRRLVSAHAMPGTVAKDKEMQAYPTMATYRQVLLGSLVTGVVVVILLSFV